MRENHSGQSHKGFTLVELLVVLTILGILAAILAPTMIGFMDKARLEKEYNAGAACLMASQMKLNTLRYQEQQPNLQFQNQATTGELCALYQRDWSESILTMSGQEAYHLVIGIGKYDYYESVGDLAPAYKVYLVGYQQTPESPVVFYDGTEWSQNCPWKGYGPGDSASLMNVNGQTVAIQFFTICYDHAEEGRPETFFNQCIDEY